MNSIVYILMYSTITVTNWHVMRQLLSVEHALWVGVTFVVKTWEMVMTISQLLAKANTPIYTI